jgi:hypothetical protein
MTICLSLDGRAQAAWEAEADAADGAVDAAPAVDAAGLGDAAPEQPAKTTAPTAKNASMERMPGVSIDRVERSMVCPRLQVDADRKSIVAIDFVNCGSIEARHGPVNTRSPVL